MDSRVISGFWLPWRAGGGSPENKVREQVCDNACRQTPLPEVKQDQDEKGWGFQQHSVESQMGAWQSTSTTYGIPAPSNVDPVISLNRSSA